MGNRVQNFNACLPLRRDTAYLYDSGGSFDLISYESSLSHRLEDSFGNLFRRFNSFEKGFQRVKRKIRYLLLHKYIYFEMI